MEKTIPIYKATIDQKCGDCLCFNRFPKFSAVCSKLGRKAYAQAPACFVPDAYVMTKKNPLALYQLGLMLSTFDSKETRVLLSLIRQVKTLEKKYDLKFGQPVFFRLSDDYLSNYCRGFVLGVGEQQDQVYITSDLNKKQRAAPFIGSFMRSSVMTVPEFKKHKKKLQDLGKLLDPKPMFSVTRQKSALEDDEYAPPTLAAAPKEWFDKQDKSKVKIKKKIRQLDGKLEFTV